MSAYTPGPLFRDFPKWLYFNATWCDPGYLSDEYSLNIAIMVLALFNGPYKIPWVTRCSDDKIRIAVFLMIYWHQHGFLPDDVMDILMDTMYISLRCTTSPGDQLFGTYTCITYYTVGGVAKRNDDIRYEYSYSMHSECYFAPVIDDYVVYLTYTEPTHLTRYANVSEHGANYWRTVIDREHGRSHEEGYMHNGSRIECDRTVRAIYRKKGTRIHPWPSSWLPRTCSVPTRHRPNYIML